MDYRTRTYALALGLSILAACGREPAPQDPERGAVRQADSASNEGRKVGDRANENTDALAGREEQAVRPANQTPRARSERSEYGRIEGTIIKDGAINMGALKRMKEPRFDEFMTAFESETADNTDAQQLTREYALALEKSLEQVGGGQRMARFTCGANVCMGYTQGAEDDWFEDWYRSIAEGSELSFRALTTETYRSPSGVVEHRILFTTKGDGGIFVPRGS